MNILAPALIEVKSAESIDAAFAGIRETLAELQAKVAADLAVQDAELAADDWDNEYVAHLEAEHAADAALDFATEHGFWPC